MVPRKLTRDEFKQIFQELNRAHTELARVEDIFFERKGAHIAAGEAVMWISAARTKTRQILEEQHPKLSRAEYYEITGRKCVF